MNGEENSPTTNREREGRRTPNNGMWILLTPSREGTEQTHDRGSGQTICMTWRVQVRGENGHPSVVVLLSPNRRPTNNRTMKGGGWMRQGRVSEERGDTWISPP